MVRTVTSTTFQFAYPRHPWWGQAVLQARRSLDGPRLVALAALVGATVLAIVVLARNAAAAHALFDHRQLVAIATAVVQLFALRPTIAQAARSLRYGWTATLPLPTRSGRGTLLSATILFAALLPAWLAVVLTGLGLGLGASAYVAVLGDVLIGGVAACAGLTWFALRAWERPATTPTRPGTRNPLVSLAWLESPQLPFLVAWQNRECTRLWRSSGGAKPVGVLLLLFPGAEYPWTLFSLIAVVVAVAWFRCALRASLAVATLVVTFARQWTQPGGSVASALSRFPLACSALAISVLFGALLTIQPLSSAAVGAILALPMAGPITIARLISRFRELAK
jgi:hypothetical protein